MRENNYNFHILVCNWNRVTDLATYNQLCRYEVLQKTMQVVYFMETRESLQWDDINFPDQCHRSLGLCKLE